MLVLDAGRVFVPSEGRNVIEAILPHGLENRAVDRTNKLLLAGSVRSPLDKHKTKLAHVVVLGVLAGERGGDLVLFRLEVALFEGALVDGEIVLFDKRVVLGSIVLEQLTRVQTQNF